MLHAFDVDGSIRIRRRVFEPERRVSENLLPQSDSQKIFILTANAKLWDNGCSIFVCERYLNTISERRLLSTLENIIRNLETTLSLNKISI